MRQVVVIAHNIRSTHNVGAIFRTCEGFGIDRLILSGYTAYPSLSNDPRLPHLAEKLTTQIRKTALGAEKLVPFEYQTEPDLSALKNNGFVIAGLEQDKRSTKLGSYELPEKIALIIGEEVDGIAPSLRDQCEVLLEIPMKGKKESFNVSVATGIALYVLTSEC